MKLVIKEFVKEIPKDASMSGKIDCMCNTCKKKTFHFLYEKGKEAYAKCLHCSETFRAEVVA
jgi:hypothetical protein